MKIPASIISCLAVFWLLIISLTSCHSEIPIVNLGIDDVYYIYRMQKLNLQPSLSGASYRWSVMDKSGEFIFLSSAKDYIFLAPEEGEYNLKFEIIDAQTPYEFEFRIHVLHEEIEYNPYISKVYEYFPAPGQFINEMPLYEEGDTYQDILKKAEDSISGTNDIMISLGGWGGYVTFGFDHTVINFPGEKDFRIWGNCFYELLDPEAKGGSSEPGIVLVSYDSNCNGIPDDEWYELAGSEYFSESTLHGYSLTYHRPDSDREIIPDEDNSLEDVRYIRWEDNKGKEGYMPKNYFHSQDYFPKWVDSDVLTFEGSLLESNGVDISGTGRYYVLYSYPWGYVDNHPNEFPDLNSFDISWAVDKKGEYVNLPGIDFVRVYTGVNQYCGWIGETSTEICRAQDLHIDLYNIVPTK